MSRSNFKITPGEVAYVITTGEPVFVKRLVEEGSHVLADITRPMVGTDGINHSDESWELEELETPLGRVKRELELNREIEKYKQKEFEKNYPLAPPQPDMTKQILEEGIQGN